MIWCSLEDFVIKSSKCKINLFPSVARVSGHHIVVKLEIAELGFEPTASKSQEITGVGTTSDHWGRGWKPTGDERPCFFFETLLPCL
jgi:hypothetical protein